MALTLSDRMKVFRVAARHAAGKGAICDPLPAGKPLRAAAVEPVRPALFVPEQISRVTQCTFGSTLEAEMKSLSATKVQSVPPYVIEFTNAAVFGGQIFSKGHRYQVSGASPYRAALGPVRALGETILSQSRPGATVFGHWLMDNCATRELEQAQGHDIAITRPAWADCVLYEHLFDQTWKDVAAFTTPKLTLLDEIGHSRDKAERQSRLRKRVRDKLKSGPGGVIYLMRGPTGNRREMMNEPELLARLEAAGVAIIQCESHGEAMIKRCLDARIILGIEGSQLCHAIYLLREGGAVMAIQPPDRFCNAHHHWSRQLDMHYGTVIGSHFDGGWKTDPDEVLAMIDQLLEQSA